MAKYEKLIVFENFKQANNNVIQYLNQGGFETLSHVFGERRFIAGHNYFFGLHSNYWNRLSPSKKLYILTYAINEMCSNLGIKQFNLQLEPKLNEGPVYFSYLQRTIFFDFEVLYNRELSAYDYLKLLNKIVVACAKKDKATSLNFNFFNANNALEMNSIVSIDKLNNDIKSKAIYNLQPWKLLEKQNLKKSVEAIQSAEFYTGMEDQHSQEINDELNKLKKKIKMYREVLGLQSKLDMESFYKQVLYDTYQRNANYKKLARYGISKFNIEFIQ